MLLLALLALLQLCTAAKHPTISSPPTNPWRSDPPNNRNVLMIVADDAGFETSIYGNEKCKTPYLNEFAQRSVVFQNAFTSVSSCSPSRSAILTGLPQHENGMYGLYQTYHHFHSFDAVQSLPRILNQTGQYWTGIIGKKHVGPDFIYPFAFSATEENYPINLIGRNITLIMELADQFLTRAYSRPFFLYIGFHDPHRCGHDDPKYGPFCEKLGDGTPGNGLIPDWHPIDYDPEDVDVPYFVPDTPEAREDIAAQYRTISRLDQGIGLMLELLTRHGYDSNTLVIYTSDNGIPFPNGRTNLYDSGIAEPLIISNPLATEGWGTTTDAMVSSTDLTPTVLDWFGLPLPTYNLFGPNKIRLQGQSLLPLLENGSTPTGWDTIFASHSLHEVTMYYPMRALRNQRYKLIHNMGFHMPFPIDQDFYVSPTFQGLLNRTISGRPTYWFKSLREYYYRSQWELYDLQHDPSEINNVINISSYADVFSNLKKQLLDWQRRTNDPWLCAPGAVFENEGQYPSSGVCLPLDNGT